MIVHHSGWIDLETIPPFWTEVPALAACASEGATMDEVVAHTKDAIATWLRRGGQRDDPIEVTVFYAG